MANSKFWKVWWSLVLLLVFLVTVALTGLWWYHEITHRHCCNLQVKDMKLAATQSLPVSNELPKVVTISPLKKPLYPNELFDDSVTGNRDDRTNEVLDGTLSTVLPTELPKLTQELIDPSEYTKYPLGPNAAHIPFFRDYKETIQSVSEPQLIYATLLGGLFVLWYIYNNNKKL